MATAQIIDLDALVGPPKQVRLGGEVYRLPADLPAELFLKINSYAESELSEAEMAEDLYEELLELFRVHQPDLESIPFGVIQLVTAIPRIYGAAEEATDPPKPRSKAGTRSTSRKKTTRSRSTKS